MKYLLYVKRIALENTTDQRRSIEHSVCCSVLENTPRKGFWFSKCGKGLLNIHIKKYLVKQNIQVNFSSIFYIQLHLFYSFSHLAVFPNVLFSPMLNSAFLRENFLFFLICIIYTTLYCSPRVLFFYQKNFIINKLQLN